MRLAVTIVIPRHFPGNPEDSPMAAMNKITVAGTAAGRPAGRRHRDADCSYPKSPVRPARWRTATQEEMVTGMKAIKEYNARSASTWNAWKRK